MHTCCSSFDCCDVLTLRINEDLSSCQCLSCGYSRGSSLLGWLVDEAGLPVCLCWLSCGSFWMMKTSDVTGCLWPVLDCWILTLWLTVADWGLVGLWLCGGSFLVVDCNNDASYLVTVEDVWLVWETSAGLCASATLWFSFSVTGE